jgi:hypothetical protein
VLATKIVIQGMAVAVGNVAKRALISRWKTNEAYWRRRRARRSDFRLGPRPRLLGRSA